MSAETIYDALYTDGTVMARFTCETKDIHELPDGSVMFYSATIVESAIATESVGQVRDIFAVVGGGIQFNAAKNRG